MAPARIRLEPLTPEQWDARTRTAIRDAREQVGDLEGRKLEASRPPNILRTIAHHPTLLEPFLGFAATLATRGALSRRASELLALRAAWNCRSSFEWGHHVVFARSAGLDDEEIERVSSGPSAPGWSAEDRDLLVAADELHDRQDLSDATWEKLSAKWDAGQLVEIPFIVGHYTMLSMVAKATGVPLEPGLPELPSS